MRRARGELTAGGARFGDFLGDFFGDAFLGDTFSGAFLGDALAGEALAGDVLERVDLIGVAFLGVGNRWRDGSRWFS